MQAKHFTIEAIPAMLWGDKADKVYLFIHGKSGCKEEAADFAALACAKGWQVLSIDLPEHGARQSQTDGFDPWHVVPELKSVMQYAKQGWGDIALRANSIGAWFSLLAFAGDPLENCLFVSPVLDMQRLIENMMGWASVSSEQLQRQQIIPTAFGETLSWRYYTYTKEHSISKWTAPTHILYAGKDNLTQSETVDAFARRFHCQLHVMADGEHWFHTKEQLAVLRAWENKNL